MSGFSDPEGRFPLIRTMKNGEEVFWVNPDAGKPATEDIPVSKIADARERLRRFAPYIAKVFPETAATGGIIESPLREIPHMKEVLGRKKGVSLRGRLLLKCDSHLPISGSIKARGGIYEVLTFAEEVALKSGMLTVQDDYSILAEERFRKLFSEYAVAVGSTGNLGLSIGIMSARLGFQVTVHMSADARQWKKDLLRQKGAIVVEYQADYEKAVEEGRKQAARNPKCHFVDDENSLTLFLGYSVAGERTAKQLKDMNVTVDSGHPLFVYLPCGVGGGPGGVAFGLKQVFGDSVHCFFAEPVQAPCMLLGLMTGLHNKISVQDIGLTGHTAADGLAVGRPSALVGRVVGNMLDGLFTVDDDRLYALLAMLASSEEIRIEPSAAAGFPGFELVQSLREYAARFDAGALENATHIVWATGGSMVPKEEMENYIKKGKSLLSGK